MILTDGTHLVSDTSLLELDQFACLIGLKPRWFQLHRIPHYDLLGYMVARAIKNGAQFVTTRQLVRRAIRQESTQP